MITKLVNRVIESRNPDFVIAPTGKPYLLRWWVIPRNRFLNIYIHRILESDDDRALHDHPWSNFSYLVEGEYDEHRIADGGIHQRFRRKKGSFVFRAAKTAHRLEVIDGQPVTTIFVTGPRLRNWGFHCPMAGWIPWEKFCAVDDKGKIGPGCGD